MLQFEEYLSQFSGTVKLGEFLIHILLTAILAIVIKEFYVRYGHAISNRKRFAANFLPLALSTMLIITIVKSSIALSLGLVGALSIVRFRAAIKDPEELTYLFLVIALGLATGANQGILAILAIPAILFLLFLHKKIQGIQHFRSGDMLYLNISTDICDLELLSDLLVKNLPHVDLKRFQTLPDEKGLDLTYLCKADSVKQLNDFRKALLELSPASTISVIDQPDIIS